MNGSRATIAWITAALVGMAGCHSSPWSATREVNGSARTAAAPPGAATAATASQSSPATTSAQSAADQANKTPAPAVSAASTTTTPAVDAQAMQKVIAELQQAGTLDPASRDRLMEDLKQTDPSLWPLVIQQFRAGLAYRQQSEQRRSTGANPASSEMASASAPIRSAEARLASRTAAMKRNTPASEPASSTPRDASSNTPQAETPSATTPPATSVAPATTAAPVPSASKKEPVVEQTPKPQAASEVVQASYQDETRSEKGGNYREHLAAAIRVCESELPSPVKTPEDEARHAQLRMLQLLAGRRDEAMKSIPGAKPAVQNFWSAELYGLSLWMDAERTPDVPRRAADARQHLNDALVKLGESCPLVVKNLAFCNKIQSYGCVKQFDVYEFSPGQNVLLYAEVENLSSEATPQGIHTSLRSSYQILDNRGQRVADEEFPVTEENCRNVRRDYFVGYEFRLPERIYPGKHTLQLTVEDLRSKKVGQSTIEFTVKK